MLEGIGLSQNISFMIVFVEGIISFFSPCVIPLIPIYVSFLSGSTTLIEENNHISFQKKKLFLHTLCFVLGISFAFFILGMTFTALGSFFLSNKILFTRIGGIIIVLLGLFQLGIFDLKFLQYDRKFHLNMRNRTVNPLVAFVMGFTFSFAWTPCVGPALSSVLIMASGAQSPALGNLLVLVYALGFIIPFLFLGLFTTQALNLLTKHQGLVKYTVKAGGLLLVIIGLMTFTGWMNSISSYLNLYITTPDTEQSPPETPSENPSEPTESIDPNQPSIDTGSTEESPPEEEFTPAIDFTLVDQYGETHTLSDYQGKVVFLNFWASWCSPCLQEMPHIEARYQAYNLNQDEVVILGIANPKSQDYPYNQDIEKEEIIAFLAENEYTFPTVFDETGEIFQQYYISSFPTTFMIDKKGNFFGYAPGMLTADMMESIIQQTLDASE